MEVKNNEYKFAAWTRTIKPSIMQKMLEGLNKPGMISFALGLPDAELFPRAKYKKIINKIISSSANTLNYAPPISSLKQHIVKLMATRKVKCSEEQILLTNGAQQAVSILSRLFLNQNSVIVTEALTYPGFLQIVEPYRPKIVGIPMNSASGLCLSTFEKSISNSRDKPAFFYTIPEGHNPLGTSLSSKQKQKIATLSRLYQIPIIEDDVYGFLNYGVETTSIRTYEDEWVFYVGTFSKIIAPALRVGWIIAPEKIISKLAFIKEGLDINTTSFGQRIVDGFLATEIFPEYMSFIRRTYKHKRDVMLEAIEHHFPKRIKVFAPASGIFIWVELSKEINTTILLQQAMRKNVAFMPSEAFACNPAHIIRNGLRLNFSYCEPAIIQQGVEILGKIIST